MSSKDFYNIKFFYYAFNMQYLFNQYVYLLFFFFLLFSGEIVCNACGLYFKLHGINRPSHLFRTAPMTRRRNPKKKKEDAFCKILPATNSKQSGIPDLESGSLEQLDQSGEYIIAQQYDLSIYIPWLFPPVYGVADNTKETTKAYIYISTFYILIYIFGFKFLKKK